ncbi:MAG: potassium channel family protein [Acidimicrobiales bacterium]
MNEVADVPVMRYVRIFVCVVLLFAVQAAFREGELVRVAQVVLTGTALVLAAQLESGHPKVLRVAWIVSGVSLVVSVVHLVGRDASRAGGGLLVLNGLLVAAGPVLIVDSMRRHPSVSVRTLLGAVTIYVLIGLFFAYLYRAILLFDHEAFTAHVGVLTPAALQYFSFVTLTTVGFGDITAVSSGARTLVALEALIGQIYLVTVVALVVGNLGRRRQA